MHVGPMAGVPARSRWSGREDEGPGGTMRIVRDWRERLVRSLSFSGAFASILLLAARPFDQAALSGWGGESCGFLAYVVRCSGPLASAFGTDDCGVVARHRLVLAAGFVALSVGLGTLVIGLLRGSLHAGRVGIRRRVLGAGGALAGTLSGLWAYGFFDRCNTFAGRWQAAAAGLGIAVGILVVGSRPPTSASARAPS